MSFRRKNDNSENHTKPSSTLCWKNSDLINVEAAGLRHPTPTAYDARAIQLSGTCMKQVRAPFEWGSLFNIQRSKVDVRGGQLFFYFGDGRIYF